jgi:hypothetical protein
MLDNFLKVGSTFDWITPLWAIIQDTRNGPSTNINLPFDIGWSGSQIKSSLQNKGIKVWGLMAVGDVITFTVSKAQEQYAMYWLEQWGLIATNEVNHFSTEPKPYGDHQDGTEENIARTETDSNAQNWIDYSTKQINNFTSKLR